MTLQNRSTGGRSERLGAVTESSTGTLLTAGGSSNQKGNWETVGTASFAYEFVNVSLLANSVATSDWLVDLGIDDGAGNVFVFAENLMLPGRRAANEGTVNLAIPLHVPNGAIVVARVQAGTATSTCQIVVTGYSTGLLGMPGAQRCICLVPGTNSRGVAIDPGGTANQLSGWIQLNASTPHPVCALFGIFDQAADVSRAGSATMLLDIGVGDASSEFVIASLALSWGTTIDGPHNNILPLFPAQIPAGSRVSARAQCSINTAGDRVVGLALYGLVP